MEKYLNKIFLRRQHIKSYGLFHQQRLNLSSGGLRTNNASSSSVNEKEIAKFSEVSKEWWNPRSKKGTGPLHYLNPVRVKYIRERSIDHFAETMGPFAKTGFPFHDMTAADIGCGGGILSESLARLGALVTSIDPSEENIHIAQTHSSLDPVTAKIDYRCNTVENLAQAKIQYDIVCSLEVIEHVDNVQGYLESLCSLVKPGGILFMSTLNRTAISYMLAIIAAENVLGVVPRGTHDWNKFIKPQELTALLQNFEMETKDISGIIGDPITNNWKLSSTCTEINYIMCATKPEL